MREPEYMHLQTSSSVEHTIKSSIQFSKCEPQFFYLMRMEIHRTNPTTNYHKQAGNETKIRQKLSKKYTCNKLARWQLNNCLNCRLMSLPILNKLTLPPPPQGTTTNKSNNNHNIYIYIRKQIQRTFISVKTPQIMSLPVNGARNNIFAIQNNTGDLQMMTFQALNFLSVTQIPNKHHRVHSTRHNRTFYKVLVRRNPCQWSHKTRMP